jgi:hypothetical protein
MEIKRYYKSEEDFRQFYINSKQLPCPFCKLIGALILHGYLRGYGENSFNKNEVRGRRIICNNRKRHTKGCGRTFCVLAVDIIKHFCITANSLWCFLKNVVKLTSKIGSSAIAKFPLSFSSVYRLWKKFLNCQSRIRTYLTRLCPEPKLPTTSCPATQTIEHLKLAFSHSSCPIAAFQDYFQTPFI